MGSMAQKKNLLTKQYYIRNVVGSVTHIEKKCMCFGGTDEDDILPYRESVLATVAWIKLHGWKR